MFKSKLIENEEYYKAKRKQLLIWLVLSIPMGLLVNFYMMQTWAIVLLVGIYIIEIIYCIKNDKLMKFFAGSKMLEIDDNEIRILGANGKSIEIYNINNIDKLYFKNKYGIPQENISDVFQESLGNHFKNYIIIQKGDKKIKYDFLLDSYYMLVQLNKHMQNWINQGVNKVIIEKITTTNNV